MKIILIISLTLLAIAGACGEFEKDKKIAELEKKREQSENILTETESETNLKEIDIIRVPKTWDTPEEQGEYLFTSYGCSSCHSIDEEQSKITGPGLWEVYERADSKVEGLSAEEYLEQSIKYPSEYVVEGYPEGVMPVIFENLPPEEIKSLIAYLKTLRKN